MYFFVSSFPVTCHLPKNYSLQLDCTSSTKVKKTVFFLQKIILLERNGEEKKQPDKQKQNRISRKKNVIEKFFPSLGQIRLISFYVSEDHLNNTTVRWRRLLAKVFFYRKFVFFISKKSQFQGSKYSRMQEVINLKFFSELVMVF